MPHLCISINLQSFNSWNLSFVGQISGRRKSSQGLKFRAEICDAPRVWVHQRITLVTTSATPLHASYFECSAWHASCENAYNSSVFKMQPNPHQIQNTNKLKQKKLEQSTAFLFSFPLLLLFSSKCNFFKCEGFILKVLCELSTPSKCVVYYVLSVVYGVWYILRQPRGHICCFTAKYRLCFLKWFSALWYKYLFRPIQWQDAFLHFVCSCVHVQCSWKKEAQLISSKFMELAQRTGRYHCN